MKSNDMLILGGLALAWFMVSDREGPQPVQGSTSFFGIPNANDTGGFTLPDITLPPINIDIPEFDIPTMPEFPTFEMPEWNMPEMPQFPDFGDMFQKWLDAIGLDLTGGKGKGGSGIIDAINTIGDTTNKVKEAIEQYKANWDTGLAGIINIFSGEGAIGGWTTWPFGDPHGEMLTDRTLAIQESMKGISPESNTTDENKLRQPEFAGDMAKLARTAPHLLER